MINGHGLIKQNIPKLLDIGKVVEARVWETTKEYSNRISGIMRVYLHTLKIRPVQKPLYSMFQLLRYWAWFARILNDRRSLAQPIAPQLIYSKRFDFFFSCLFFSFFFADFLFPGSIAALDVLGLEAKSVWGQQWDKMIHLIETGVTTGYEDNELIGGDCAEGSAARTRVMFALENL